MSNPSIASPAGQGKRKAFVNFLSLSLLQVGNYVLPMLTLPIISRIIGPGYYGVINYAFAFVGYFVLLINAGFDLYGSRLVLRHRNDREECSRVFSRILSAKFCLLLVAALIFAAGLIWVPQLREDRLVAVFTFAMCFGWVINPSWLYHGMQESRRYAVFSFLSKLLFSVLVVLVVRQRSDYLYHPLITSAAHLLVSWLSLRYALRKYGLTFTWPSRTEIKDTLSGNRRLALIWWVSNQAQSTNIVIAGIFLSTIQIGYFSAALRLMVILQSIIAMPLNMVLFPYISEAFLEGKEAGMDRLHKTFPYVVLISGAVFAGTMLFAGPVILGFYGHEFSQAIPMLRAFAVVLFLTTVNGAFGQQVLINLGKERLYLRIVLIGAALNILLLPICISLAGVKGAAWAWPLSEGVLFLVYLIWFRMQGIRLSRPGYCQPSFLFGNLLQMLRVRQARQTV